MKHVYRFAPNKNCELYICGRCYFETKPKRLNFYNIEITQDNTKLCKRQKGKVKNVQGRSETGRKVYRHGKRKSR